MRPRYQEGSLTKKNGRWIAQWWEAGSRKKKTLGKVSDLTKTQAKSQLSEILEPINKQPAGPSAQTTFGEFVRTVYLPFYCRKWKRSTTMTNEQRIACYLIPELDQAPLGTLTRTGLQDFLDGMAARGLSHSVVAHIRWDFRQVLRLAKSDGYIHKNPAEDLFVPRDAPRPQSTVMTMEEVICCIACLDRREALIAKLALLGGFRPGEIFALRCGKIVDGSAQVSERVYRNDLDTPKSRHSVRNVALPEDLYHELLGWIAGLPENGPDAWVFPSENPKTPAAKDNVWRRNLQPRLKAAGLGWVNFHVFRRTHATLMRESGADPRLVADNMGHSLDVNQNVYTQTTLNKRKEAVNALESKFTVN